MPAWQKDRYIGTKLVTVFPGNSAIGLPAVASGYTLADARTGAILAQIDGGELTARRTAAASALAASYLSRADSRTLVVLGTGRIAANLIEAYAAIRDLQKVIVWGRNAAHVRTFVEDAQSRVQVEVVGTEDRRGALANADLVTAATLSTEPIVEGGWLKPGTHVDLIGGYRPTMREADDETIRRAGLVVVDTRAGAMSEAGDIIQPMATGVLGKDGVAADLADLCRGTHPGRTDANTITVFKSVGTALEDLAAATAAYERLKK
jgi:ornithine cyclodeaminase